MLDLQDNDIRTEGAKYLSDALRQNSVGDDFIPEFSFNYLDSIIQTLTTLNLKSNYIGNKGVQYLSDALKQNTVGNRFIPEFF